MKRLTSLAVFLLFSLLSFAQFSGSGSGTENDPYLILNPIQLNQLRNYLNQQNVYFKLMADIDLTEFLEDESPSQGWQPVGSSSAAFKGILDGNGKTVSGLWIKRRDTDYVGFFGNTDGATIKNISIVATSVVGKDKVGGMSGYSQHSTIDGCSFTGSIQGGTCVGGFIGDSGNNITLSKNLAVVTVSGTGDNVGGYIGNNNAYYNLSISDCILNNGVIQGANYIGGCVGFIRGYNHDSNSITNTYIHSDIIGNNYVGGICGSSNNTRYTVNLNTCGFVGNIIGNSYIGGLVGLIQIQSDYSVYNTIQNCFAICKITVSGDYVGGLVGRDESRDSYISKSESYRNSYFNGSIIGGYYVGGLVGYKKYGQVLTSYAAGKISGKKYVGGLVGSLYQATLKSSTAINTRVTATEGIVGRIVGENNQGTIGALGSTDENKSYNRTIVISQGVAQDVADDLQSGTGVSASTLKLKATFVAMGCDFNNTWDIQETESFPYMLGQTAPPVITSQIVAGATTISGKCVDGGTITLEIDGVEQQVVSSDHKFSFSVSPLQAGHEVRVSAKAEGKEPSYYTTEVISFLGKGTEADPYQVYTAADLQSVYRKGYYKLMNDIDLTSYISQYCSNEGWESIGRDGSETIHFDGDGHKITGLWCNSTRDNTGLFSCFANGTIKNLNVQVAKSKQVKGGGCTGIIIGKMMNGEIINCKAVGTVADGTPVGGMIGKMEGGKLIRCLTNVNINTTGEKSYVGGLVGEITSGEIDQCATLGLLKATGTESYVGGLVGKNYATVTNSYSCTQITSSYNAAGLIAYNYGVVDKCYATGNLYSNNYAAGIIGYNDGADAVVRNCVAMNKKINVKFESQSAQSGGYGQRIIGGIKNSAPAPELNNYALKTMQVSVNDVPQKVYNDIMNGVAKTDLELLSKSIYQDLGWDFSETWVNKEGENYPSLQNNIAVFDVLCELVYKVDGQEYNKKNVTSGSPIVEITPPEKEGYTFTGWFMEDGDSIPELMPINDFTVNARFSVNYYTLTYMVDGKQYKVKSNAYATKIAAEPLPIKEGYTFSGWSEIPETMPAQDVTITGSFTINSYKLNYLVDGISYKASDIVYATELETIASPKKEGYTFVGWFMENGDTIPKTMPAKDVTVLARFNVNTYKLTTIVENESKTMEVDYNVAIEVLEEQGDTLVTKKPLITEVSQFSSPYSDPGEGNFYSLIDKLDECPINEHPSDDYWHSNWHNGNVTPGIHYFQVEMPDGYYYGSPQLAFVFTRRNTANDQTIEWSVRGTNDPDAQKEECEELLYAYTPCTSITETIASEPFNPKGYKYLRFYSEKQIGKLYGSQGFFHLSRFQLYPFGFQLDKPEKEGHTFAGWFMENGDTIPERMPAHDITVTARFNINSYKLTYKVDEEEYKTNSIVFATPLEAEPTPVKEGYTFSGWSEIPDSMPAHDVIIKGLFNINTYKLTYLVDSAEYKTDSVIYATKLDVEVIPLKEGYTFIGWSELPDSMPAHDVTVNASFTINSYKLTYMNDGEEYKADSVIYKTPLKVETPLEKEGFTFSGWFMENGDTIPQIMPANDVTVYAKYVINSYKLTYIYDNESKTEEINYNESIEILSEQGDTLNTKKPLITEVSQFSSPFSDPKEGNFYSLIEKLDECPLDEHPSDDYWHSSWHDGDVIPGTHYFQVEMPEGYYFGSPQLAFVFTRRRTPNDHTIEWSVRGTNDFDATKESCEELLHAYTPYSSSTETITSEAFNPKGYKYLRFYSEEQYTSMSFRGFFHLSRFQLYPYGSQLYKPEKEGHTFAGWFMENGDTIPDRMPAHDVTVTARFNINSYKLTYKVDGEEYKVDSVAYSTPLQAEPIPIKEGYTFSGWSEMPDSMPANDVTIIGSFSINTYKLAYVVDGIEYKTDSVVFAMPLEAEEIPVKEGYTFSGWSEIPETMPAKDVTVTGTFSVNSYTLLYVLDGEEYKKVTVDYGTALTAESAPEKEGYAFSGWSEIPETMPAKDVTVTGTFSVNSYKVTFKYGDEVLTTEEVEFGAVIPLPESLNSDRYTLVKWLDVPETMPARDIIIQADYVDGVKAIQGAGSDTDFYQLNGVKNSQLKRGLNIIRTKDGKTHKVAIK